jgi:MFS family permease
MPVIIGLTSWWPLVLVVFAIGMLVSMVWNVITVSLRQQIIPDHLLGRVNSVYRFFGWGMMPLGTALGGIVVWLAEPRWGRIDALRAPFFVSAAISLALAVVAVPKLTTERIESARAAAQGHRPGEPGA